MVGGPPRNGGGAGMHLMADHDDERRLLRWIAENGGPPATINVVARSGEIGLRPDEVGELVDGLAERDLVEVLEDGDVHLTPAGRAMTELPDS
jgi:Mn-dependent DtxR family transcriptional regulator